MSSLGRDTLIYGVGKAAGALLSLALLPVYTRILPREDFGTIEALLLVNAILSTFIVLGLDGALSYFFFQVDDGDQEQRILLVTARFQFQLVAGLTICSLAWLSSPWWLPPLLHGQSPGNLLILSLAGGMATLFSGFAADIFRLLERPWGYVGVTLTQSLVAATVSLTTMFQWNWKIEGFLTGYLTGSGIAALTGWFALRSCLRWAAPQIAWWKRMAPVSLPLVPTGFCIQALTSIDRVLVSIYLGPEGLGVYAVGLRLASALQLLVESFRQAFWPRAMKALREEGGADLFRRTAILYLGACLPALLAVTTLAPIIVPWITHKNYHGALSLVGPLCWPVILSGLFMIVSPGFWKTENTRQFPLTALAGLALGIPFYLLLIPIYGLVGAAMGSALSHLAWLSVTLLMSERLWLVGFARAKILFVITVGMAMTFWVATHV